MQYTKTYPEKLSGKQRKHTTKIHSAELQLKAVTIKFLFAFYIKSNPVKTLIVNKQSHLICGVFLIMNIAHNEKMLHSIHDKFTALRRKKKSCLRYEFIDQDVDSFLKYCNSAFFLFYFFFILIKYTFLILFNNRLIRMKNTNQKQW